MRRGILADFNSDTSLDLIMVGRDANVLEIHANNGIGRLGLGDRVAPDLQLLGEATVNNRGGRNLCGSGRNSRGRHRWQHYRQDRNVRCHKPHCGGQTNNHLQCRRQGRQHQLCRTNCKRGRELRPGWQWRWCDNTRLYLRVEHSRIAAPADYKPMVIRAKSYTLGQCLLFSVS